jgi:TPR repeat protein
LVQSVHQNWDDFYVICGIFLLNGLFCQKNEETTASLFRKASELFYLDGIFWYGYCLVNGIGAPKKFNLGIEKIQRATKKLRFISQLYYSTITECKYHFK